MFIGSTELCCASIETVQDCLLNDNLSLYCPVIMLIYVFLRLKKLLHYNCLLFAVNLALGIKTNDPV